VREGEEGREERKEGEKSVNKRSKWKLIYSNVTFKEDEISRAAVKRKRKGNSGRG